MGGPSSRWGTGQPLSPVASVPARRGRGGGRAGYVEVLSSSPPAGLTASLWGGGWQRRRMRAGSVVGARQGMGGCLQRWVLAAGSPRACPHGRGWQSRLLGSFWLLPACAERWGWRDGAGWAPHRLSCEGLQCWDAPMVTAGRAPWQGVQCPPLPGQRPCPCPALGLDVSLLFLPTHSGWGREHPQGPHREEGAQRAPELLPASCCCGQRCWGSWWPCGGRCQCQALHPTSPVMGS